MGWGDILHNALKDTEGLVNPKQYYRTGKFALSNPVGFGKAIGKSYLDLAEHPVRTLENHPVDTLLQFAPMVGGVGKLADISAEAGTLGWANKLDKAAQGGAAQYLRSSVKQTSRVPGVRAAGMAKALGHTEKTFWNDMKYRPGKGGSISDSPGIHTDRGMLGQLQDELGHPNTSYHTDYATQMERGRGTAGVFQHGKQIASTLTSPRHFVGNGSSEELTKTFLHEARHGYQKANWSRPNRFIDLHRPYAAQRMEKDANTFSESAFPRYREMVTTDPGNSNIPDWARPKMEDYGSAAKRGEHPALLNANDFNGVKGVVDNVHMGLTGQPSMEEILNHMDALVATGQLTRQEAIDLQMHMADDPFATAAYSRPKSQSELLRRGQSKARSASTDEQKAQVLRVMRLLDGDGHDSESIYLQHRGDHPAMLREYKALMQKSGYPDSDIKHLFG